MKKLRCLKKEQKSNGFDSKDLARFFKSHSFICSLHTLDASMGITNTEELSEMLKTIFINYMLFRGFKSSNLLNFVLDFVSSFEFSIPRISFIGKIIIKAADCIPNEKYSENLDKQLKNFLYEGIGIELFTVNQLKSWYRFMKDAKKANKFKDLMATICDIKRK